MKEEIVIALAGNPNAGKSVFFNQLTGENQHVGNWPGKTVEKFEGKLNFLGKKIRIIDLPGAYSLSAFSQEEEITRDFIKNERPDVIINIIDASNLEQSLFLTLQLLELSDNVVIALNKIDILKEKGREIDAKKLSKILKIPVVPTTAIHGKGIEEVMVQCINTIYKNKKRIKREFPKNTTQRYNYLSRLVNAVQKEKKTKKTFTEIADSFLLNGFFGFVFLAFVLLLMFFFIFTFGNVTSSYMYDGVNYIKENIPPDIAHSTIFVLLWEGVLEGIIAVLTIALPFLIPFYIFLAILEDVGYLPRMAFLTDGVMHKIGLHGKAFLPLFIGYGCSVPACIGCRIMETEEQRFTTAILATLIPCAARSVVILSLIGSFLGFWWVVGIYAFNLVVVFVLGFLLSKLIIKKSIGLIMNMPPYNIPNFNSILRRAFLQINEFVVIALPVIVLTTFIIKILEITGLLYVIVEFLSPITAGLLGLPPIIGVTFFVGFLRKELIVVLLATLLGTENFGAVLSPLQLIVLTIVTIFYIPCVATVAALVKEFGLKKALFITAFEILFALMLGAIAYRILPLFGIS